MGLSRCPYYYKNGINDEHAIYFKCCHKRKEIEDCPDGRMSNECEVLTLTFENVILNMDVLNRMKEEFIKKQGRYK